MAVDRTRNANANLVVLGTGRPGEILQQARRAWGGADSAASFAAELRASLADIRSQTVNTLVGALDAGDQSRADAVGLAVALAAKPLLAKSGTPGSTNALAASGTAASEAVAQAPGLSPTGRNLALFDPESAYRMMTLINQKEVAFKAEFSEMHAMGAHLANLRQGGAALADVAPAADTAALRERLAAFVAEYNDWVRRFDDAMQTGGALAGTQAARVARYELMRSIDNPFFGAADGFRGMAALGLTIDPVSKLAVLDLPKLDAALASQTEGAVRTVQEFGRNFARSAELLVSEGNFVTRRLGNLDRVIRYLDEHKALLQAEFGMGDPARPTAAVAQAVSAYQTIARS